MVTGVLFDILRCSMDDGPGIRTTVFFKGCPLHCLWCHNPESQSFAPQLSFDYEKCVSCGRCAAVCDCHTFADGRHTIQWAKCTVCGKCVSVCPIRALEIKGRRYTADEVMAEVLKDRAFYQRSGGGVTFSGGEPCAQPEFLQSLLTACKNASLHTAVETSGCATKETLLTLLPLTDLFMWDYKATEKVADYIGRDNALMLENLNFVICHGARVRLRCPIIPGVGDNETHLRAIAALSRQYPLDGVDILPYHNMGVYKSEKLGRKPWDKDLDNMSEKKKQWIRDTLEEAGCIDYHVG